MKGLTPLPFVELRRALRGEGITFSGLARVAGVGRAHLSQVLRGRRTGGRTWNKVRENIEVLAPRALPHFDALKMEQSATWNTTR